MAAKKRAIRGAVLILAEGMADRLFAEHIRSLYTRDGAGHSVKARNVGGKGAENVVKTAMGCKKSEPFDFYVAMFDGDTWSKPLETKYRNAGLTLIISHPCIEATLLEIHGTPAPDTTEQCKREFKRRFGFEAHDQRATSGITKEQVDVAAKGGHPMLRALLAAIGVPVPEKEQDE